MKRAAWFPARLSVSRVPGRACRIVLVIAKQLTVYLVGGWERFIAFKSIVAGAEDCRARPAGVRGAEVGPELSLTLAHSLPLSYTLTLSHSLQVRLVYRHIRPRC